MQASALQINRTALAKRFAVKRNTRKMATKPYSRSRPPSRIALDFEAILVRYPRVTSLEVEELISLYRRLAMLDLALMVADKRLAGNVDAFWRDQKTRLRSPIMTIIVRAAFAAIIIAGATVWQMGAGS